MQFEADSDWIENCKLRIPQIVSCPHTARMKIDKCDGNNVSLAKRNCRLPRSPPLKKKVW